MTRTPPRWARKVIALATQVLPAGPIRDRYHQELDAEMFAMTRWQAVRYVLEVVATAPRLRGVVKGDAGRGDLAVTLPAVPIACRLNLRHRWHIRSTDDGGRYKECARCRKEYPGWTYYLWRYPGDNVRGSWGA
jgi:hypothetical protein